MQKCHHKSKIQLYGKDLSIVSNDKQVILDIAKIYFHMISPAQQVNSAPPYIGPER